MTDLSAAIRTVRKRLGKTMAGFGDLIGCKQSTVSRYESGKLEPSRTVLILLLQLAEEPEKGPLLRAMESGGARDQLTETDLAGALETLERHLKASAAPRRERAVLPPLAEFARLARDIVAARQDIDPALVDILHSWIKHHKNRNSHRYFRQAADYLHVQLWIRKSRKS